MGNSTETGVVTSVGELGKALASNDRFYWNEPHLYSNARKLEGDWWDFEQEAIRLGQRRAMMRTMVTSEVLEKIQAKLPLEAVIPIQFGLFLIYIGRNQHSQVASARNTDVPKPNPNIKLDRQYRVDQTVSPQDDKRLFEAWGQFGWTLQGVRDTIAQGTKPMVVIRDSKDDYQIVGAMIAESLGFELLELVEITEMAVLPQAQNRYLATILIQELCKVIEQTAHEGTLVYGEYNMSTNAHKAATRAGGIVGNTRSVSGVLADHVGIVVDPYHPNPPLSEEMIAHESTNRRWEHWDVGHVHNFLVVHHPMRQNR